MNTFHKRVRRSKADKLRALLSDGEVHSTRELIRHVGHTFAVAKWKLVHQYGCRIEVERHPTKTRQFRYRLIVERVNG